MKHKITIAIVGELGYYKASTLHNDKLIEATPRITLLGAINAIGFLLFKETGLMLMNHPLTINYQPEEMPGIDEPSKS